MGLSCRRNDSNRSRKVALGYKKTTEGNSSYTILAERRDQSETQEEVELIGSLVSEATFSNGPQ